MLAARPRWILRAGKPDEPGGIATSASYNIVDLQPGRAVLSAAPLHRGRLPRCMRILQTFYQRWKLKHVDEAAFRAVAEEVSKRDLSNFFPQWLHTTELYDYAVGKVKTEEERGESCG